MMQFHCKKCNRTWKMGEENKAQTTYSEGVCGDCLAKTQEVPLRTTPYWGDWYRELLTEWERLSVRKLEVDTAKERHWYDDYYRQGYEPRQACEAIVKEIS